MDSPANENPDEQQQHLPLSNQIFTFRPIAFLQSVYKRRVGTPRQGLVVTQGRACIELLPWVRNGAEALKGLEVFSHCWVLFVFHENTNSHKDTFRAKVHPPRMDGQMALGLFGTRSPHRPCPIGLSVCKIDRVRGNSVWLSGIDLIDGTPILDIKPYVCGTDDLADIQELHNKIVLLLLLLPLLVILPCHLIFNLHLHLPHLLLLLWLG